MKLQTATLILALTITVSAQEPDTLWTRSYGTDAFEECLAVRETNDGGFLLAGRNFIPGYGEDIVLMRTSATGDSLWSRSINVAFRDQVRSMARSGSDGFILSINQCLVRVNSHGDSLGTVCVPDPPAGWNFPMIHGYDELASGNVIYGGLDYFWVISPLPPFDPVLTYTSFLAEVDTSETLLWTHQYINDMRLPAAIKKLDDGGFIMAIYRANSGLQGRRTDSLGIPMWERTFGVWQDCDMDEINVLSLSDGGYVFGGPAPHVGENPTDYRIVKTDESGDTLWTRLIPGFSLGWLPIDMYEIEHGELLIAGTSSDYQFQILKTDNYGEAIWSRAWETPSLGSTYFGSCMTSDGGVVLVGRSGQFPGGGFYMLRVSSVLSTNDYGNSVGSAFELSQNYPNPFNATTKISYSLPKADNLTLTVFNLLGAEMARLVDGFQTAGSYTISFDAGSLASGVYLYRLQAGEFSQANKMILLK